MSDRAAVARGATLLHRAWGNANEARTKLRYAWHEFFRRFVMWRCERPLAQDAVEVLTLSAEAIGGIPPPQTQKVQGSRREPTLRY